MSSKAVRLSDSSAPNAPKPEPLMSRDSVDNNGTDAPMYTIPIDKRPPHGPLFSKIFFPILFNIGQIGILTAVLMTVPLLLIPVVGKKWFEAIVGWAKDGYGRLCTSPPFSKPLFKGHLIMGSNRHHCPLCTDIIGDHHQRPARIYQPCRTRFRG